MLLALLLFAAGALSVPVLHEGGHALVAALVGGRSIRLRRRRALLYVVEADLPDRPAARRAFYAAGSLANLVAAGALAYAALAAHESERVVVLGAVALAHLLFAVVNLLPLEGHDGAGLFR